ncbi:hypothetical protein PCASD_05933 [Puccinia coronata f. sp. avenae]|uniref:Uncharacterized protein n=1 Tax=Puccinia coronata f. sp. avenae TaxID=200324 RepID=A0A2N5V622_9BASI|nr:hypothetical protein PCASD_05933 [Puccinia coronata f. sp. avenae]
MASYRPAIACKEAHVHQNMSGLNHQAAERQTDYAEKVSLFINQETNNPHNDTGDNRAVQKKLRRFPKNLASYLMSSSGKRENTVHIGFISCDITSQSPL